MTAGDGAPTPDDPVPSVLAEVRRELGLSQEGVEVPTDLASLTRLASLGTLSRDAGERKDAVAAAAAGGIFQAPGSRWITPADEAERPGSAHDPPDRLGKTVGVDPVHRRVPRR